MVKQDIVWGHYHKDLDEELKRIRSECENQGIFLKSKKEATQLLAEKSRRGFMNEKQIKEYLKQIHKIPKT